MSKESEQKDIYKNYEELPIMLSVPELAKALGISRAGAYDLARSKDFPHYRIGNRIIIPKDKFLEWVDRQMQSEAEA